jgi:hypothetical protein
MFCDEEIEAMIPGERYTYSVTMNGSTPKITAKPPFVAPIMPTTTAAKIAHPTGQPWLTLRSPPPAVRARVAAPAGRSRPRSGAPAS